MKCLRPPDRFHRIESRDFECSGRHEATSLRAFFPQSGSPGIPPSPHLSRILKDLQAWDEAHPGKQRT